MAFMKFACDGPFATGAVRTTLDRKGLAFKLSRHRMPARVIGACVEANCGSDRWTFGEWERDGDGWITWLRFTMNGDLAEFSRRLATHAVRHRLEWSEPLDTDTDHIRRVTRFSYRWDGIDRDNKNRTTADIEKFEEHLR